MNGEDTAGGQISHCKFDILLVSNYRFLWCDGDSQLLLKLKTSNCPILRTRDQMSSIRAPTNFHYYNRIPRQNQSTNSLYSVHSTYKYSRQLSIFFHYYHRSSPTYQAKSYTLFSKISVATNSGLEYLVTQMDTLRSWLPRAHTEAMVPVVGEAATAVLLLFLSSAK